ncbi:GDSL family lipase [Humisphaera borealis]|uniref:GDSL family lipase n=1 Tax=Humisphaera borealis TaxID=2807512 RepID=A0A7M2X435_9BACT|nr:GDSL family lipase [Humisphaera borealis]
MLGRSVVAALLAMNFAAVPSFAQTKAPAKPEAKPAAAPAVKEAADKPAIKMGKDEGKGFLARHEGFLADLKATNGKVDVLFVGDSITDGWRRGGKKVFDANYGSQAPLNIGIGGDRTQHVIWRLQNGEVEGISPKVAMLMIGTNNLSANTDEEIVAGITKCVTTLREKLPKTKVLLLGVFPRSAKPTDAARARIKTINAAIAKLDDAGKTVKYLDIGEKFLDKEGNLTKEIMPDALHPNEKGYEIWAEAVKSTLADLMK